MPDVPATKPAIYEDPVCPIQRYPVHTWSPSTANLSCFWLHLSGLCGLLYGVIRGRFNYDFYSQVFKDFFPMGNLGLVLGKDIVILDSFPDLVQAHWNKIKNTKYCRNPHVRSTH